MRATRRVTAFVAVAVALAACGGGPPQGQAETPVEHVRRLLRTSPLIDGHNDLGEQLEDRVGDQLARLDLASDTRQLVPPMHTDIARLRAGGVGGQFWSAYVSARLPGPEAVVAVLAQIDVIQRFVARYPDTFAMAYDADDVERIFRSGRIASLIGVEGGYSIGDSLAVLRQLYLCGARYLTLTHWLSTDWADAATDAPRWNGLSPFGVEVVREMNRLGMLVDLSHVSDDTMNDALDVTVAPVIFSHSSARALCNHRRNVPDDVLRRVATNGGVVMVNFAPGFVSEQVRLAEAPIEAEWDRLEKLYPHEPKRVEAAIAAFKQSHPVPTATLAQVADHIDHIRQVAGIDHVGLGSDFDGISSTPVGLEDVSHYPDLLAELMRRGYSDADLVKVAGGNILRVMREAESVAARLQRKRGPSEVLIDQLQPPPSPTPTRAPAPIAKPAPSPRPSRSPATATPPPQAARTPTPVASPAAPAPPPMSSPLPAPAATPAAAVTPTPVATPAPPAPTPAPG
jgi:membrane dipeptidase